MRPGPMNHEQRHKRLRELVKKVNKQRKLQAKKIDILCNDFVNAHRDFIRALDVIGSSADFYQSILGVNDLSRLLDIASDFVREQVSEANIVFFLRREKGYDIHVSASDQPIGLEQERLENLFNKELVHEICTANKICAIDDLLSMGLSGNPKLLNKLSAYTIPLGREGVSLGFALLYRDSENKLSPDNLRNISEVTAGLSSAVESCLIFSHSAD